MIPGSYATLTAVVFVLGGLLACFAGFRLFRFIFALYGFLAGAIIGSGLADPGSTFMIVLFLLVGGVVGAAVMYGAYFIAVGLVGAGLSAMALHLLWGFIGGGDPPTLVLVIVCVIGAVLALQVVRYVVILGTAMAGSWTAMVGGMALMGNPKALIAASAPNIWVIYPMDLLPPNGWMMLAWVVLGVAGFVTQLKTTTVTGRRRKKKAVSE